MTKAWRRAVRAAVLSVALVVASVGAAPAAIAGPSHQPTCGYVTYTGWYPFNGAEVTCSGYYPFFAMLIGSCGASQIYEHKIAYGILEEVHLRIECYDYATISRVYPIVANYGGGGE